MSVVAIKQFRPKDKQRELAVQLRMMAGLERSYTRRYAAAFDRRAREVAKAYEASGERAAIDEAANVADDITPILIANIAEAAKTFGDRMAEEFAKKAAATGFDEAVLRYTREFSSEKIVGIKDVTISKVRAAIKAGREAGEANRETAKRIRSAMGKAAGRNRALTIAITETHNAATFAADTVAAQTGLDLEKEWVAAEDQRTRPSHNDADGTRVGMNEKFVVGGVEMSRPGDPAAPAREVVRCRCILVYHPKEE